MDEKNQEAVLIQGETLCDQAAAELQNGNPDAAITAYSQAEKLFETVDATQWLTFVRHEKFRVYHQLGRLAEAIELADQIAAGYKKEDNDSGLTLFMTYQADVHLENNDIPRGLECLRIAESIALEKELGETLGHIYSNMAAAQINLEDYTAAIAHLGKALEHYSGETHSGERAWCEQYLGICYQQICHFKRAEKSFYRAHKAYLDLEDYTAVLSVLKPLIGLYQISGKASNAEKMETLKHQIESVH